MLRFRYTSYMGEHHPAEKKVVVQFSPADLGLTDVQADKLRKLVGPRYNPETDVVKMSSEKYEHQAQNKRYLSNLVDDLIASAKVSISVHITHPYMSPIHACQVKFCYENQGLTMENTTTGSQG